MEDEKIRELSEKGEIVEMTENLLNEKDSKNNSGIKNKLLIFGIIFGAVIIGLGVILILNGQKTASIAKELELGEKYLEEGLYEEAKLAFDKVIEIDKKEVRGYEGKAEVAIILKAYPEAEKVLEEAKVIEVTDQGKVLMAEVYINTERKDQGKELMEELKITETENRKINEKLSALYQKLAEEAFLKKISGVWKNTEKSGYEYFQISEPGRKSSFLALRWIEFNYEVMEVSEDGNTGSIRIFETYPNFYESSGVVNKGAVSTDIEIKIVCQPERSSLLWFDKYTSENGAIYTYMGPYGTKVT